MIDGWRINPQLGLLEALEGAQLLERRLTVTTNNLANIDTPGYKEDRLEFREVLMKKIGPRYIRAFKETVPYTVMKPGPFEHTGNPFDLAIAGEGFFKVQTPNGIAYTRAGDFTLDSQRRLVTPDGYPVLANGAPIVVDPGFAKGGLVTMENIRFTVSPDGLVSIDGTPIGKLDIVTFDDISKLKKIGKNLFVANGAHEIPAKDYQIRQGYIESSNVDPVKEMVKLIEIQRRFQSIQKFIQGWDETTERLINTANR
ncbi:MAG: flagellar basal-body rod protein FlgF [Thermodesulfobacteria bacterium]|nr:flagellar basal-body rod protein FlgF [Thermodesulfobacteriota bacterium]